MDPTAEGQNEMESRKGCRRGAPQGHKRFSPIPNPPKPNRRELDVLLEHTDSVGHALWRLLSDLSVWSEVGGQDRAGMFLGKSGEQGMILAAAALASEIGPALSILAEIGTSPTRVDPAQLGRACGVIARWAEAREMKMTALQFAEAAARVESDNPRRSYVAGRLCRRTGDHERAKQWLRRARRLARRDGNEIDFAHAHRGYGFVLMDQGRFAQAEPHFLKCVRAAMRVGRRSLAGSGYHDLFVVAVHLRRNDAALHYARKAIDFYKTGHPRFPLLAHDVAAFFWMNLGFYSSALPVLSEILPYVHRQRERILVHASIARCAAAVRDNLRYRRAADEVLALAALDEEMTASSLYHVAEGARCFHDWTRAEELARMALDSAERRGNATIVDWTKALLDAVAVHLPGDTDAVPPLGGAVDELRTAVLRKLTRQPAPTDADGAVPPEEYPTD